MKPFFCTVLLVVITLSCKKNKNEPETELEKLPPITQTGANTFGCLVNGVAWLPNGRKPDGWFGKPNLEVYINESLPYRSFGITAGQYNGERSHISFGTSKNLQNGVYNFDNLNIDKQIFFEYQKFYWNANIVEHSIPYDSLSYRKGKFTITRLSNSISGIFEIEISKFNSTDTLKITNGRFDMKL
jgi:hypothetical protein